MEYQGNERRRDAKEVTELATKLLTLHADVSEIKNALLVGDAANPDATPGARKLP